jgi:hypothetical protein
MTNQTILFTVMPRSMSVNPETMPVSVYVSPRLTGDEERGRLGEFPDWLTWTRWLKESGLHLTFRCNGAEFSAPVPTDILQPKLWEAMFNKRTLVRSHTFDDYSEHEMVSYSTRNVLSLLKGLYQRAGVELALPNSGASWQRSQRGNQAAIQYLVDGLAVNWNAKMRDRYRDGGREFFASQQAPLRDQPVGADGLFQTTQIEGSPQLLEARKGAAQEFSVFHHIPAGKSIENDPPDFGSLMDFHQALSSLNSYPELLRALGLVIDFELPQEFIPITFRGTISVVDARANWQWRVPTSVTPLETVYAHMMFTQESRIFLALPKNEVEALGLLILDPQKFGLAQVDVDGGMHKTIMLAETVQEQRDEKGVRIDPAVAPHPEVFDPNTTLPSLRSGGLSLFADGRGEKLIRSFKQAKAFQQAAEQQQPLPELFAEDLVHGYRLDIWDSHTNQWHSLHRRNAEYKIKKELFTTTDEEGFTQLAAAQPAPNPDKPPAKDMYVHEAIARWAGWSLSVPFPGKALSSDPDPQKALDQPDTDQNVPATPFKMTTHFKAVGGSLPSLRFGRRYRVRARVVDICGNSLTLDHPLLERLTSLFALPQDPEGFAYLRYEPVNAPQLVLRDEKGVKDPGSQLDRLVIRTYNRDSSQDGNPADLTASDRHILPPRTSVEMAERLGMLDDATGRLNPSPALYNLLAAKDGAELNQVEVLVAGQMQKFPLEGGERIDSLPYLPDVLSAGAALRDLPGTPGHTIGTVRPGPETNTPVAYDVLNDPSPRPGSATLISFGGEGDWQTRLPFRLALDEGDQPPHWDAQNRVLTVSLPKGTTAVVPLTSHIQPDDLKLMGIWQWLREYIEQKVIVFPDERAFDPRQDVDRIAHILQRAVEGGHWMLTPPHLLTLVHAVQQPIGNPAFRGIPVQHEPFNELYPNKNVLQTSPEVGVIRSTRYSPAPNPNELDAITAWRRPGSTDVYLLGGLHIHAASTARVDILAKWNDPVDDVNQPRPVVIQTSAPVDEIPIHQLDAHVIHDTPTKSDPYPRALGYYEPAHDLLCFTRQGDRLGNLGDLLPQNPIIVPQDLPDKDGVRIGEDAAPRHQLNDTKHHRITYTARSTSRYREYFPQTINENGEDKEQDFTRSSKPVVVEVPASSRPAAPIIAYVIPTFGWQRQTQTNVKRSIRFGGGLRVYFERPWLSSGEGELLGVTLYPDALRDNISKESVRDQWKSSITQWGNDPIWQTQGLPQLPAMYSFPDAVAMERFLSLEGDETKRVDVVGYPVIFDEDRQKWFCDLKIDTLSTYSPFIRLALVRYQPCALADAKVSRVVLADFAQLTNDRAAVVSADPYHPRQLQVTISGVKPDGPLPQFVPTPTHPVTAPTRVEVEVQRFDDQIGSDLAWSTVGIDIATVQEGTLLNLDESVLWTGTVRFAELPAEGQFRLLLCEYEYISAEYTVNEDGTTNPALPSDLYREGRVIGAAPRRLVYAETIAIDSALIAQAPSDNKHTKVDNTF